MFMKNIQEILNESMNEDKIFHIDDKLIKTLQKLIKLNMTNFVRITNGFITTYTNGNHYNGYITPTDQVIVALSDAEIADFNRGRIEPHCYFSVKEKEMHIDKTLDKKEKYMHQDTSFVFSGPTKEFGYVKPSLAEIVEFLEAYEATV